MKLVEGGKYKKYTFCRFCKSKKITPVIDLGSVPLAGGFLKSKKDFNKEKFYPLELSFCKNCLLLQSTNVVDGNTLFKNYFYRSSVIKTLTDHFGKFANELRPSGKFVVEIGSNDGYFVNKIIQNKGVALGVDPATNIVRPLIKRGAPIINSFFTQEVSRKIVKQHGKADYICSFNTLAHIEDMHEVFKAINILLKNNGVLIFETHYLGDLIDKIQYDMIYHEHQYYYSLLSLSNLLSTHNMEIFNIKHIKIHGGSMRYYVQKKVVGRRKINNIVLKKIDQELEKGLDRLDIYIRFNKKVQKIKSDLLASLNYIKKSRKNVIGFGASGRGTTIMNYVGLTEEKFRYVIDDSRAKQGCYIPGTHQKIIDSKILNSKKHPDYVLLFAWAFYKEIKNKNKQYLKRGGKFLIPLPKVKVIA